MWQILCSPHSTHPSDEPEEHPRTRNPRRVLGGSSDQVSENTDSVYQRSCPRRRRRGEKDELEEERLRREKEVGEQGETKRGLGAPRKRIPLYLNLYVPCVIRKTRAPFEFRRLLPSNVPPRPFAVPRLFRNFWQAPLALAISCSRKLNRKRNKTHSNQCSSWLIERMCRSTKCPLLAGGDPRATRIPSEDQC